MPPTNKERKQAANSFREIFERCYPAVYRRLACFLGNNAAAEDIAQETFIRLFQKPPGEFSNLDGWLAKVATNLACNYIRSEQSRRRREAGAVCEPMKEDPADVLVRNEDIAAAREVLMLLPERERDCLLLRFSGMSYAEIAPAAGVKESSVGTLLARARARFKTEFIKLKGSDQVVL